MKKKFTLKNIGRGFIILLIICQFIPVNRVNPASDPSADLLVLSAAPDNISSLVKTACYDCHSNESAYPWYAYVAPASWWLRNHISDGRRHLNFSTWGAYPEDKKERKLKQCQEEIEENEMPLSSYTWLHKQARLTEKQKADLITWFKSLNQPSANNH